MNNADPNLKKQQETSLEGSENGIEVYFDRFGEAYFVRIPQDRVLIHVIHSIEGAEFNKELLVWRVNLEKYDELALALSKMRKEIQCIEADSLDIVKRAKHSAQLLMNRNGADVVFEPRITHYRSTEKPFSGEILNVNARFAAQLIGFSSDDGTAFINIHRLADLDQPLFKDDKVVIQYDEKMRGTVSELSKSLREKLDESLGKYVDGVKVVEHEGKYKVSFDYNPALQHRIQRISGGVFNKEECTWEIGADLKPFIARAVNDMRREVLADRADREQIERIANEKIDAAKVKDAFITDGQSYSGKILAKNDRYILQHTGKDCMTVHRNMSLNSEPNVGSVVKVIYQQGRGQIAAKSLQKEYEIEH